ncbi:M16 family metallopeptidase [Ferrimonas lipolytica]|uniref:Insulinase family protein n=1 Tax=Ferrimonas lipolytica TaxID=2724191 RepID=A0A6H1U9S2_9GAMM|nr:pitrilysin family protein [Ferrimonas lipolytica]QIZ75578.1 insulinase family protein [Ferrimonas lipolytica]
MRPLRTFLATAVASAIFLTGCASQQSPVLPNGVTFIEQSSADSNAIHIPYQKYQLDNGLTVLLSPDSSDPLVHVDVTYHVGSAREQLGKSGFAHFFEHMMFQGSANVADEQHFKVVTEAGGTLNGTTNTDRTNYYETVPANQLEKMLWLEADRMGFLLPAVTEQAFEIQRETVKNERGQRVDNRPYGRLWERVNQAMYPQDHPYSWPVIGWLDDLDRGTVADLRQFFQRWYGPNNATLTIGGDIDPAQTLAWVNRYFGSIPAGPAVVDAAKQPATLDVDRYISMEDKVHLPLLYIGIPTVYARHEDEAALDLLAKILGGGKTSIFYKNMVENGFAVQAQVGHPCRELACELTLFAIANPSKGAELSKLEGIVRESIAEFERRGVTAEDLAKAKVQNEARTLYGLQSVSGKVSTLAYNQTFFGQPDLTEVDLQRYNNVTEADVLRVFNTYVKDKAAVIMSIVPEGQRELIAAEDNWQPQPITADMSSLGMPQQQVVITDSFDRSQVPEAGPNPVITMPSLWRQNLANGIEVIGSQSTETPTTEILIALNGGNRLLDPAQAGLAQLTAAMMAESTESLTSSEFVQELEKLGSSISISSSGYRTYVSVSSLSRNVDPTLALLQQRLWHSAFNATDFERVKGHHLQNIQQNANRPEWLAGAAWAKLTNGEDNPQGWPQAGTLATVQALTLADVKAFYQRQFSAGNASVVAVSDLPQAEIITKLAFLGQWQGEATPLPPLQPLPTIQPKIYLLDKPGAAQSVIRIGKRSNKFDATGEHFLAGLMNYPLGGAFNSRINLNLREDKGYTYGARTGFSAGPELGQFVASASVRADVTAESVQEFITEIQRYHDNGISADELAFMKASISQRDALKFETPAQKARFLGKILRYDLDDDFVQQQADIVNNVTVEQLNRLANKELKLEQMAILVVGDKASNLENLQQLGYEVIELTL